MSQANWPQMEWPPRWDYAQIPPHLIIQNDPNEQAQQPPGTEPHEAFQRLKWSVLDPPSQVQIFGPDDNGVLQWRPLFEEPNRSIYEGAATQPPQSRMEICIEPLHSWWHWQDTEAEHLKPQKGRIENLDGQHVSVRQFIQAVHDYAVPLRELLLKCTDVDLYDWDRARLYFDMILNLRETESGECRVTEASINVVEDSAGDGNECAWIWKSLETRFKKDHASQ